MKHCAGQRGVWAQNIIVCIYLSFQCEVMQFIVLSEKKSLLSSSVNICRKLTFEICLHLDFQFSSADISIVVKFIVETLNL